MGNDSREQLPSQPAITTPVTDLDDLLSKLSTWDGSSNVTHGEPASLIITQDVSHSNGQGDHLEMKEIEPKDIDFILHQSGADSSSFAGASTS